MDNVETQQLDIRSVPDPESPDKALPADSAAPKKLKDMRRLRRKVSPPSTPTTTASPPSKKDEEDLAFTPEGKVLECLSCVVMLYIVGHKWSILMSSVLPMAS